MRLPNAENALIAPDKIAKYLLDPTHPDNGGKAAFFLGLGYNQDDWSSFADALRQVAISAEVTKTVETMHGTKYIVDGPLGSDLQKRVLVRTVWIVDRGQEVPRLITAYPCEGQATND